MALADNLIAYWKLDGNSNDAFSTNNGTDTSVSYSAPNGKIVQGAGLNGTTSKIVIADAAALKPTGSFTVAAWFKTSTTGTEKVIFQSEAENTNVAGLYFEVSSANKAQLVSGKNTGTTANTDYKGVSGNTTVTDGNWHLAVGVYDGAKLTMYLDGVDDSSGGVVWTNNAAYQATNYVRIGCGNHAGTDIVFFNGAVDEVGFWSRALSAAEVTSLYNSGNGISYIFPATISISDSTALTDTETYSSGWQISVSDTTALTDADKVGIGWNSPIKHNSTWIAGRKS